MKAKSKCIFCGAGNHLLIQKFTAPSERENTFGLNNYLRSLMKCKGCGLLFNDHNYNMAEIYRGLYREHSYDGDKMHERFLKIKSLPPKKSDNHWRVKRIQKKFGVTKMSKKLLDIGSGIGIFPFCMSREGWDVTCIDPDKKNIEHIQSLGNIKGVCASVPDFESRRKYSLVTLNKVLEHLEDPIMALSSTLQYLKTDGIVYIEVPDGESALANGTDRQELFLEHYYAFNVASVDLLATNSGFRIIKIERAEEPSGKLSIFAFLEPRNR